MQVKLHYADVILDSGVGVVVRPLQLLSSEVGLKVLVNCVSALSLQYEQCWLILHSIDSKRWRERGRGWWGKEAERGEGK